MKRLLVFALAFSVIGLTGTPSVSKADPWKRSYRKARRQYRRDYRDYRRDLRRSYRRFDRRYSPRYRYIQPRYGYGYSRYPYRGRYRGGGVYLPGFSVQW